MNKKELNTIKQLIESEIELAEDSIRMYNNDGDEQAVIDWAKRLADALQARYALADLLIEEANDDTMVRQTSRVQSLLNHCCNDPGADIYILVSHHDGTTAGVKLYDHAALVQELYNALEYFLSEL